MSDIQPKRNKQLVPLARHLRTEMTREERHLWYDFLRHYPICFFRQKVLGKYIADFYCAKAQLVIELDGSHHGEQNQMEKDDERTAFLNEYGIDVIRIPNAEIREHFDDICRWIDDVVKRRLTDIPFSEIQ